MSVNSVYECMDSFVVQQIIAVVLDIIQPTKEERKKERKKETAFGLDTVFCDKINNYNLTPCV